MERSNRRALTLLGATVAVVAIVLSLAAFGVFTRQDAPRAASTELANTTTVVIPVEGMACVACAARVKQSLAGIDGVADVEVNLADRNARVRFDPTRLGPEGLVAAINELGYRAGTPAGAR